MTDDRHTPPVELLAGAAWRKSSFSGYQGNCVEVAHLWTGAVAVRNSRHPAVPPLAFAPEAWSRFLSGVTQREFGPATDG